MLLVVACSKHSDSGEWCEVKKAMKSRGVSFLLRTAGTPGTGYISSRILNSEILHFLLLSLTIKFIPDEKRVEIRLGNVHS